jgi:hypothetical protein
MGLFIVFVKFSLFLFSSKKHHDPQVEKKCARPPQFPADIAMGLAG